MDIYSLSRSFWDYSFENPDKIKPNHIAMYFFAIEHCNRLGWKEKFGFPTTMVMDAISIKSYNTFIKTLSELVDYGFIKMIEKSKNQYSANIITLSKFNKANDKALDKAMIKHSAKQVESTVQSNDSIDIHNTNIPIDNSTTAKADNQKSFKSLNEKEFGKSLEIYIPEFTAPTIRKFFNYWSEKDVKGKMKFQLGKTWDTKRRLQNWKSNESNFTSQMKVQPKDSPTEKWGLHSV